MAAWTFASQFFLIALLSLNVYSFPAKEGWNQLYLGSSDVEVKPGVQRARSQGFQPRSSVSWVIARPKQTNFPVPLSKPQSPTVLLVNKPPKETPPPNPERPAVSGVDLPKKVPPPLIDQRFPPVSWITLPPRRFFPPNPQNSAIPWVTDPPKILTPAPSIPEAKHPAPPSKQGAPFSWIGYPPKKPPSPSSPEGPAVSWAADPLKKLPAPLSSQWLSDFPEKALPDSPPNPQGPAVSWVVSTHNPAVDQSGSDIFSKEPTESSSAHFEPSYQVPPDFQAGEHDETMESNSGLAPFTYPEPMFQGGQMSNYATLYERGNSEREMEDHRLVPAYPYAELTNPFISMDGMLPQSAYMRPVMPNLFYFLTGQLPHGTVSHTQTDYEAGGDHTTEVGYERYVSSMAKSPGNPPQIKVSAEQL
ncbi:pollen-specific leucine-rich repeat extensin-like protein 2 [Kryptolebias marmoratus]|uniref:pollen-specific leucine-rich repeat extensin-like protein 2 n=1 Tax=Kryptolebias marmoratus TaxID=37003 RepID=UPI0007F90601|nr:pollen-specific leucine-rich repeat extensin-like protein 2 [Kryptolebias marmoratus]